MALWQSKCTAEKGILAQNMLLQTIDAETILTIMCSGHPYEALKDYFHGPEARLQQSAEPLREATTSLRITNRGEGRHTFARERRKDSLCAHARGHGLEDAQADQGGDEISMDY